VALQIKLPDKVMIPEEQVIKAVLSKEKEEQLFIEK
jgi:hypothetical protein